MERCELEPGWYCDLHPAGGFLTPHLDEGLIVEYSHDRPQKGVVMSDFLADLQSYLTPPSTRTVSTVFAGR